MLTLQWIALTLLCTAPGAEVDEGVRIVWRGAVLRADALPAELRDEARAAVLAFAPWTLEHGYELSLDDDARLLLVAPARDRRIGRWLRLMGDSARLFERVLPPPPPAPAEPVAPVVPAVPAAPPARPSVGIPEDPEEAPAGLAPRAPAPPAAAPDGAGVAAPWRWGAGSRAPDTDTAVVLVLRQPDDYASLLALLASRFEYLREWSAAAAGLQGFVLEEPLAGAFLLDAPGMEEWNSENELVNRVAQLLLLRRFGRHSHWIVQGFAWFAELEVCRAVYCFPDRKGFVGVGEHTDWDAVLASRFAGREREPLALAEFAAWRRGRYEDGPAKVAFGVVSFLARHGGGALPAFLDELRRTRERGERQDQGDGSWLRRRDFDVPLAEQERLLRQHFGDGVLAEMTTFFRKGKSYRPPR